MRLWSLHPRYLDAKGLVAVWREGLLALEVLKGNTRGYTRHPQLERFRKAPDPVGAVKNYLWAIREEALVRGYRFNPAKISRRPPCPPIAVTVGQLSFEMAHLKRKLRDRSPAAYAQVRGIAVPDPHPLFAARPGDREKWEKSAGAGARVVARAGARRPAAAKRPTSRRERPISNRDPRGA